MKDTGVILRHEGGVVIVDVGGREVPCVVRKSMRREDRKGVTVGDRVHVEMEGDGAVVVGLEPRRSAIARTDPSRPRRELVLVANVDLALIVASTRTPPLTPGLIDRFLVASDRQSIGAAIAITKIDLDPERSYAPFAAVYRSLGYPVLEVCAATGAGIDQVALLLKDRTTVLLGHSGVGKSSLANHIDPTLRLRVGEVNRASGLGIHTTTTVSLLRLPGGGYLVDTPGIREFGLREVPAGEVAQGYREIAQRAGECRFNDCLHVSEPACAVKAAVASGLIASWRYDSYLRVVAEMRQQERQEEDQA